MSALDASLFVSDVIHKREITLGDGTKHELHLREISSEDLVKLQTPSPDPIQAHRAASRILAKALCTADGKDAITAEEAGRLHHGVRMAIATAIAEIANVGSTVGKVLPPEETPGSGTS
jgi:hypothetical protein